MRKNTTAKALTMSVLALVLCLSMLIGTTFAWFTDSVKSGVNKIVAGNLDVELEYQQVSMDGTGKITYGEWVTVDPEKSLFMPTDPTEVAEGVETTLWEPGHTEFVNLRVHNVGTLALKYQLGVSVYGDKEGKEPEKEYTSVLVNKTTGEHEKFKLSEHLVYNQKDGTTTATSRNELWLTGAEEEAAFGKLDKVGKIGTLNPGDHTDLTLVVYMPTWVGNEANYLKGTEVPTIYLGVNLFATQVEHENDSFGNDYDKDAWLEQVATDNEDGTYENEGQLYVKDNGSFVAVEKSETTEGLYTAEDGTQYVATADALKAADPENGEIGIIKDITEIFTDSSTSNNAPKTVNIPDNKEAAINLDGNVLKIESNSGCNGIVANDGAKLELSNGTITMNKVYGSTYPVIKAEKGEITLDNMTVELTADSGYGVSAGSDGGKVIIKNTTVKGPNSKYSCAVYTGSQATLEFEGATIIGGIRVENNGNIIIKSGDFTQASFYFGGNSGTHTVYAGTFADNPQNLGLKLASGSTVTDNGNGTWTVTAG